MRIDLISCEHCGGKHHRLDSYCDESGVPLYRIVCEPRVIDFGTLSWVDPPVTELLRLRIEGHGAAAGKIRVYNGEPWMELSPARFELTHERLTELAVTCRPDRLEPGVESSAAIIVEFEEPNGLAATIGVTIYANCARATRKPPPRLVVEPEVVEFLLDSDEQATQPLRVMNIGQDVLDGRIELSQGMRTWMRVEPPVPFKLEPGETQEYRITTSRAMIGSTRRIMGKILIASNDPDSPERLAEVKADTRPEPPKPPEQKQDKESLALSNEVIVINEDDLGPQDEESKRIRRKYEE